jgi:beta-glucosidase
MAQATFLFPRGFLWGTATAAHQVEGNNTNNNWWAWEQQPGHILNGHKSGLACDWWGGRWREDFDRAAESSQNAHRFSVEWSRIQPSPDRWDEDALERYREMLRGLIERNMTPMVTLHHFSDPLWLEEKGGWESPEVAVYFEKFVRKTVEALREYVTLWCTINEPNVYATTGYASKEFPPGRRSINAAFRVMVNQVCAHAAAYHTIHEIQPQAQVGIAINYRSMLPAKTWFPLDGRVARLLRRLFNDLFPRAFTDGVVHTLTSRVRVPEAKGTQDFLGVNYYTRDYVAFNLFKPGQLFARRFYRADAERSHTGFIANEPAGMFEALQWGTQFGVPLFVTENGVEDPTDRLRPRYTIQHIRQVWRAVNYNWPVKGYFHWSLVDNFEWERGWTQRFGLWELDVETQARRKRPSADLYAEICRANGITSETVAKYAPEIFEAMFPN